MFNTTHSYVRRESFMCETWLTRCWRVGRAPVVPRAGSPRQYLIHLRLLQELYGPVECVCAYVCVCVYECVCVCVCVRMNVCVRECVVIYIQIYWNIYIYICVNIHVCRYMYVYIYAYLYRGGSPSPGVVRTSSGSRQIRKVLNATMLTSRPRMTTAVSFAGVYML